MYDNAVSEFAPIPLINKFIVFVKLKCESVPATIVDNIMDKITLTLHKHKVQSMITDIKIGFSKIL